MRRERALMLQRLYRPSIRRLLPSFFQSPLTRHSPLSTRQFSLVIDQASTPTAMADNTTSADAAAASDEPIISIHRSGQLVEQGTHSQLLQRNGLYKQLTNQPPHPVHSPPDPPNSQKLLWLDLEMTGLDENTHAIIEVAAIITDITLKPHARYHAVVHQSEATLSHMNDFVHAMHTKTGLLQRVQHGKSEQLVEAELCALVDGAFGVADGSGRGPKVLLAGNTVHMDRRFIRRYWPQLEKRLHYRIVDVSSWKEVSTANTAHTIQHNTHRLTM